MATANSVSRGTSPFTTGGAGALIPEEISYEFLQSITADSIALNIFPKIDMGRTQERIPLLSVLPSAFMVGGDMGMGGTTTVDWKDKYLDTAQITSMVILPRTLIADSTIDIAAQIKPAITGALARLIDQCVFLDQTSVTAVKPSNWPVPIVAGAVAASQVYARGTSAQAAGGLAEDINQAMGQVRSSGFRPNMVVADTTYETSLHSVRDTLGNPIRGLLQNAPDSSTFSTSTIYNLPAYYGMEGLWPATGHSDAELITGDRRQIIMGLRQDMEWRVLDQATIPGADGTTLINLAMQNAIALQVIMRVGFQISNSVNWRKQGAESTRYPFSVVRSPA